MYLHASQSLNKNSVSWFSFWAKPPFGGYTLCFRDQKWLWLKGRLKLLYYRPMSNLCSNCLRTREFRLNTAGRTYKVELVCPTLYSGEWELDLVTRFEPRCHSMEQIVTILFLWGRYYWRAKWNITSKLFNHNWKTLRQ